MSKVLPLFLKTIQLRIYFLCTPFFVNIIISSLVRKYTPVMLKLLIQLETPTLICTALGICNSTSTGTSAPGTNVGARSKVPVISANDNDHNVIEEGSDNDDINNDEASPWDRVAGVTEDCTLCRYVIMSLSNELEDPTTQKKFLTSVADAVCSNVPQTDRAACEDLIISQGQTVVFITLKNATPQVVCSPPWLPICSTNTTLPSGD